MKKSLFLLATIPVVYLGCKKFENFNTIIRGVIPENCDECLFIVNNAGSLADVNEGYLDGYWIATGGHSFTHSSSKNNQFEIEIDWQDIPSMEPKKPVTLSFITYKDAEYEGFIDEDLVIASIETKLKPGRIYFWDTGLGEIEYTGERTEKKIEDTEQEPDGDQFDGNWERSDGGSKMKITGSSMRLCNVSQSVEFTGTFYPDKNEAEFTISGNKVTFELYMDEGVITLHQYLNTDTNYSTSIWHRVSSYSCN